MDIKDRINEYCFRIASVQRGPKMVYAENGRRFARIVIEDGSQRHVHAFVDVTNGDVIKAGGWKAPQRGVNGLAVRFNLLDDAARENAYAKMDPYGGYLYEGIL